jgi:hypothetical protein
VAGRERARDRRTSAPELAKIGLIGAEAWMAWERSKENKKRTTKERSSGEVSAKVQSRRRDRGLPA